MLVVASVDTTVARAQIPPDLKEGQLIRITAPRFGLDRTRATFVRWHESAIDVRIDSMRHYPISTIRRLDVHAGLRSQTGRGALYGVLIGLGSGAVIGVLGRATCGPESDTNICDIWLLAAPPAGALLGTVVGVIIGSGRQADAWREFPSSELRRRESATGPFALRLGAAVRI